MFGRKKQSAIENTAWNPRGSDESKIRFLSALRADPETQMNGVDCALTSTVADAALLECNWKVRKDALDTLGVLLKKRPELANGTIVSTVSTVASTGSSVELRIQAQELLQDLTTTRPDLKGAARLTSVTAPVLSDCTYALQHGNMAVQEVTPAFMNRALKLAGSDEAKLTFFAALRTASENNPQLADTALTDTIADASLMECSWKVREGAQNTLGALLGKRPELADENIVRKISKVVSIESAEHLRSQARQTLQVVRQNRPTVTESASVLAARPPAPPVTAPAAHPLPR